MNKRILTLIAVMVVAGALLYCALPWFTRPGPTGPVPEDVKLLKAYLSALDNARALEREGKLEDAQGALFETIARFENEPSVAHSIHQPRFDIAGIFVQQGKPAKAEEQYLIIIEGAEFLGTIVRARMLLYELRAGSGDDGLNQLRALLEEFQHDPGASGTITVALAKALTARGHCREAADAACKALLRHKGNTATPVHELRTQNKQALAKLAETAADPAEVYLEQVKKYPQMLILCYSWLEQAGLHYIEARKYAHARNAFNRIVRDYPGDADSQAGVGRARLAKLDEIENKAATKLTEAGTQARVERGEKLKIVRGDLTEPTVWAPDAGIHVIVGEVRLRKGAELIIRPGTRVEFTLCASLLIHGSLVARGLPDKPIIFASAADVPSLFDWDGIRFDESTAGLLEHAVISGASRGVICEHSSPKLKNITATRCGFAAVEVRTDRISAPRKSAPVITDPRITDNGGAGLVFVSSGGRVEGGLFANNGGAGIAITKESSPVIVGAVIDGNGRAGIECFDNSSAVLEKVVVSGNTGPGIHVIRSAPTITNVDIERNSGAGIDCSRGSNGRISKSRIVENAAGIACSISSPPVIEQCRISANREYGIGCATASNPTIRGNVFKTLIGPAILIEGVSLPTITGNAFPPQGIAIRHEGARNINASDNVWPFGVEPSGLVETTGKGKVAMP
ncbi:MAG: right-handed parallel beta-helix repeat-containing protein [Planctomycetes bacterium]|nr:right-handed parallel beta-helix repeat-containing protein [Planctomycetota bacterium]